MAALSSNLLLLLLMSSLDWLSTPGNGFFMARHDVTSPAPPEPHITECISRDQATFQCWWSPGNFHNLSSPGALRLFYINSLASEWKECPKYVHPNRECFFDNNHTSIWIPYCMQLRGQNNVTYYNEEDCFRVENIVRPDPPVSLNWTLLNISPSGLNYDVMVNWEAPPSADVKTGWMRIEYEIQYRAGNTTKWDALEMQRQTQQTIFGLHVGKEYEVHIRCRMRSFVRFGEFSDPIFIQVISSKGSTFPLTLVLVFGITGVLILVMLIVSSQQRRLMMILLPPVPAPKIKGIDPELLKKGKLDDLNFSSTGGGLGGPPTYATDFYQDELWVEFIEVDAEDAGTGEKEDNQGSDTQRLLDVPQPISHHMNIGFSNAVSFPDSDSGRASCYDPDVPDQDTLMATLLPGQPEDGEVKTSPAPERLLIRTQTAGPQTWFNTDFYAQVSNVMPTGGVVLSPGQQLRIQESTSGTEEEPQQGKEHKGSEDSEEEKEKEEQFQLLVVDPEGGRQAAESNTPQMFAPPSSPIPGEGYQTILPQPAETEPAATAEDGQSPYILPDSPQSQVFARVADYTVVQELNSQHSLLLNPPPRQSPPACRPQHPLKALPSMPVGYITPDLLGSLSP
uniref:growth hormone receptor a isoform X1 n=1 Tax=Gasterosteus aculeatus aculeatus TaxID=481459 RepID=UPI001A9897AD|nr:growth hormone receptor a isoform X1 [Gasterosteus aculeatus aculeatus]